MIQKAMIEVDEQGTTAAAVTAVSVRGTRSLRPRIKEFQFIADHPFLHIAAVASIVVFFH